MPAMDIANPIYDTAFKYLMQDERVARVLIARITGLAVESVAFRPQEMAAPRADSPSEAPMPPLALFRMDFAARVRTEDGGERQVLIEIQKAKAPTVIERFRAYLGQQYASPENLVTNTVGNTEAVPLVTIYLLGYKLGLSEEAVVDVYPSVRERHTGRELDAGHPFIEGIQHRTHIVQIPHLTSRRRTELERFLAIFDQGLVPAWRGDNYVLSIDETTYPEDCGFVLRQLRGAIEREEVRRYMRGEDLLLRDSIRLSEQLARAEQKAARAERAEHETAQAQRETAEAQRETAEAQRETAEAQRETAEAQTETARAIERAEQAAERLARSIRRLHELGQSEGEIAGVLAIDVAQVRQALGTEL